MKPIRVLSCFDGHSGGRIALAELGIPIARYFASEIDKHCIKAAKALFPDTLHMGDIQDIKGTDLGHIDLLIGGSPCQGFSFSGKGLNFDDPRSKLFFEFVRIYHELRAINPNIIFMLENVRMKKQHEFVISQHLGVKPVFINSKLLSAQSRPRLYWSNIKTCVVDLFGTLQTNIPQPQDRNLKVIDILETFETSNFKTEKAFNKYLKKYYLSKRMLQYFQKNSQAQKEKKNGFAFKPSDGNNKAKALTPKTLRMQDNYLIVHNTMPRSSKTGKGGTGRLKKSDGKTFCLDTNSTRNVIEIVSLRGRFNNENTYTQNTEHRQDGKTNSLTTVQKDNIIKQINTSKESVGKQPYQQNRIYDVNGISPALCAHKSDHIINTTQYRRFTPRECARLQTIPEPMIDTLLNCGISDTQLYKMFGNGWTIEVIKHILKSLLTIKQFNH